MACQGSTFFQIERKHSIAKAIWLMHGTYGDHTDWKGYI